jgi:hypothetical protein
MADSSEYVPVAKEEACYETTMHEPLHYDPYSPAAMNTAESYPPHVAMPRKKERFEVLELLKNVCLPIIALGYFAFCYTVHSKIVPVKLMRPVNLLKYNLNTIKSATTALSIIVTTLGLLPVKSLVQDLKVSFPSYWIIALTNLTANYTRRARSSSVSSRPDHKGSSYLP